MISSNFVLPVIRVASTQLTASDIWWRGLAVCLLIAINAFFVTAEFAIVSVRRSRINQLASSGDLQAKTVQSLQQSIERLLSTTQLGITLSSLALGWIGEDTIARPLMNGLMQVFPDRIGGSLAHAIAIPLAFFLIAYLQIVLGELCPKSVALIHAEQLARVLGPPSLAIARFFNPFIWVLNQSTRWLLRLVGIRYQQEGLYNRLTPEELQLIISTSTESPGLEAEERELLTNVLEFGDVTAGEVMVPRTSIVAIPADATFQTLLEEVRATGHSRYPVMGESLDDISGILHFKELAAPLVEGTLTMASSIQPWVRPARFVPENLLLSELLPLMQRSAQPMVMVVDEFGGTAGLLTLQDVTAEIIGDIHEPEGPQDADVRLLDDQTYLVQAQLNIEEVNELLDLSLPVADDYQTLGGFIIHELQKIPEPGEILLFHSWEMTVVSAEGPRLHQIQVRRIDTPLEDTAQEGGDRQPPRSTYEEIDHGFALSPPQDHRLKEQADGHPADRFISPASEPHPNASPTDPLTPSVPSSHGPQPDQRD
ncbi:MAG: hemolysin family protein [Synechococcales bacterium]|nr:hemolysin family protein [Synechococcales bacterium]